MQACKLSCLPSRNNFIFYIQSIRGEMLLYFTDFSTDKIIIAGEIAYIYHDFSNYKIMKAAMPLIGREPETQIIDRLLQSGHPEFFGRVRTKKGRQNFSDTAIPEKSSCI